MQKLAEVEEAKELMRAATEWSLWRWLIEKGRVRATADRAVAALDAAEKRVKSAWDDDLRRAYRELGSQSATGRSSKSKRPAEAAGREARVTDPRTRLAVQGVKEADDEAEAARLDAETTFDEAERQLNTGLARQGAQKAIDSWELREKAIRKAESVTRRK